MNIVKKIPPINIFPSKEDVEIDDEVFSDLNIADKWIYYVESYEDSDNFEIYRMSADGNQPVRLLTNMDFTDAPLYHMPLDIGYLHSYTVYDSKLYIKMSMLLYCFDISTGKMELLFDDVDTYQIAN